MKSYWAEPQIKAEGIFSGEKDIVVVGGGIAGLITAFKLAESGKKVTVIEADRVLGGVTANTTAHIDCMESFIYADMAKKCFEKAKDFFFFQQEAIQEYEKLIKQYNIDCDFVKVDSYFYTSTEKDKLIDEFNTLKDIGAEVEFDENPHLPVDVAAAAFKLKNQAIFDPVKFLNALPKNFEIIENTRITDIDFKRKILYTKEDKISADKIIIATNFPIINFPGWYFLRMYKSHSYAVALDKAQDIKGTYLNADESGLTFRNHKEDVIVGGYDHRSGRPYKCRSFNRLCEIGKRVADGHCTHRWSANDCITFDDLPYVGYYSKCSKDVFVITGFGKLGMAKAMASAMLISDLINDVPNKYKKICNPHRRGQCTWGFFKNLLCTIKNLLIMPFVPPFRCARSLKSGEGKIVFYKGVKSAVYKDEEGKLHALSPYCAHLGCQLKFNPDAKTWDCPCHGSRFDIDGNIITAPTVKNQERR
ncbi:MAG TPA: FAD-dependent oxidoreductase [Clostridia bacterium]|nr:FAD-dependent oxidoreductase [Clostridia bacterium]